MDIVKSAFSSNPNNFIREKANTLFNRAWSQPPRRATSQWIDLFMKSPRMSPIHKIATDLASAKYKLIVKHSDPQQIVKQHPVLDLLETPCSQKEITGYSLLYLTEVYRLSPAGEAFWLIERNIFGVPSELWIIPPHWVASVPTTNLPYFQITALGGANCKTIYVTPDDIIWFKDLDPLNPYGRGRGRAEAVGDEMETDEYMAKYSKNKFFNDATPPTIISMPDAESNVIDRAEEQWNSKFGGFRNQGKTAFLNWDAKIQKLNDTEREMDFINSRKFLRDTINQFWNMPPELFGILENSNRSTIDAAYFIYTKNVLSQRLRSFDDIINIQLLPMFDSKLSLVHDNVVPNDVEFELKKATQGLQFGGITVDEWRRVQELPPIPDTKGNVLYTPLNMMPVDLNISSPAEASPVLQNQEENKSINKKFSEEHKTYIWKAYDSSARKQEARLQIDLNKYFKKQANKFLKNIGKSTKTKAENNTDWIDTVINWAEENKELLSILTLYWIATAKSGFNITSDLLSLDMDFETIIKPQVIDWIKDNGLNKAKEITEATKTQLKNTLETGMENEETQEQIHERLANKYDIFQGQRSKIIAGNETMTGTSTGNFLTMKSAGLEKHMWLSSRDNAVRDSHVQIDGQVVKIGSEFKNGLKYPLDPNGDASETVNCRCITTIPD